MKLSKLNGLMILAACIFAFVWSGMASKLRDPASPDSWTQRVVYKKMKQLEAGLTDQCVEKGWKLVEVDVKGRQRKLLWKGPDSNWSQGVIIALHGGASSAAHWCGDLRVTKPMLEFADKAIDEGFAVFALDSLLGIFVDDEGYSCGKRFDFTARKDTENVDLDFIEKVLHETIADLRPAGSAQDIYMTGISNGGFMTVRAGTRFDDRITAFAPVSGGDPYGTTLVCDPSRSIRVYAPGQWHDKDTGVSITEDDACTASEYPREDAWESADPTKKPAVKQFHHAGDPGVNVSCMRKTNRLLREHGYRVSEAFVIEHEGRKTLLNHFWQRSYNQPLLEFFKQQARSKERRAVQDPEDTQIL